MLLLCSFPLSPVQKLRRMAELCIASDSLDAKVCRRLSLGCSAEWLWFASASRRTCTGSHAGSCCSRRLVTCSCRCLQHAGHPAHHRTGALLGEHHCCIQTLPSISQDQGGPPQASSTGLEACSLACSLFWLPNESMCRSLSCMWIKGDCKARPASHRLADDRVPFFIMASMVVRLSIPRASMPPFADAHAARMNFGKR